MTIEELRQRHKATPFVPFDIRLADGRSFRVKSPEFLAQSPGGRTLYLATSDGLEIIDLLVVVSLSIGDRSRGRRSGGGRHAA